MTLQEAQTIVREACIKANPKLMEMSFGCEVRMKTAEELGIPDYIGKFVKFGRAAKYTSFEVWFDGSESGSQKPYTVNVQEKDVEILGHEPTLADVLLAMHDSEKCHDGYYSMGIDGGWYKVEYTYPDGNHCEIKHTGIGSSWNLSLPFSQQSQATMVFLAGLSLTYRK